MERALRGDDLPARASARSARSSVATPIGWTRGDCRRATIESLSENLTDGFTSPLFWYVIGGVPGLVLFKVVSTMDSMVGYKTPRYLRFGWCGARLDDVMNFVPARLTWLLIAVAAAVPPAVFGPEGASDRSGNSTRCCRGRTQDGARRRRLARSNGGWSDRSG